MTATTAKNSSTAMTIWTSLSVVVIMRTPWVGGGRRGARKDPGRPVIGAQLGQELSMLSSVVCVS